MDALFHDSDDDDENEFDDPEEHVYDEPDMSAADISDDEADIGDPIPLRHTFNMKAKLAGQDIRQKVKDILAFMHSQGMNLPIFLDALSWGDSGCQSDPKIQYARTALMVSHELPGILARWYNPPRGSMWKKGKRPAGARPALREFASSCIIDCIDKEMKASAPLFLSPPEELSGPHLTSLDFNKLKSDVKRDVPLLWNILHRASIGHRQLERNRYKNPDTVILNIISQCQYTRSHRRGRIPKLWAIYLKACGLSARAFDAIHALGIAMSHKWTANAIGTLSERQMTAARVAVQTRPWIISHDNINVPLRVFSQRLHNQNHFVSGCAATVWILPEQARLPPDANRLQQKHRAKYCTEVFPLEDVLYGDEAADIRMEKQHAQHILRILLDCPEFDEYPDRKHSVFEPPPPVHELDCGPKNMTGQFILGTVPFEEASYDGTLKVMHEWFCQLHLDSEDEEIRTGLERIIAWIGDQLTVERMRGLWKYRHEDFNSFDRMDYLISVFGWFHLVMALANSLHKQYLGTSAGIGGMRQAFDILKRKGLISQSTKGPFWHHLDEAIKHISEAHFRASWLVVGNVTTLGELMTRSPQELRVLADRVVREHASREALTLIENQPTEMQDQVAKQWIMWNMDVLPYLELRDAIKCGDVGRMEDLLPTLLFRFAGGGNPKYTIEILQEENIGDIKVDYRSHGPGATMEYMQKVSPAIPTLREVQRHMESQFHTLTRGAHHGIPDKEKDVAKLTAQYVKSELHIHIPGRKIKTGSDKALDYLTIGANNLERLGTIEEWFSRRSHMRSTTEDWSNPENT